jgi:hypothetical protein
MTNLRNFGFYEFIKFDELVKSHRAPFAVIPAKAGIQYLRAVANHLDSGFRRSDDFLRTCQILRTGKSGPQKSAFNHRASVVPHRSSIVRPLWIERPGR